MEDLCTVMPATIVVLRATTLDLFRYQAIVWVVEGLESGVPSDEHQYFRLGAWPRHRRPERWHPQRVALIVLVCFDQAKGVLQVRGGGAVLLVAMAAELPRLVWLALPAGDAGDQSSGNAAVAFQAQPLRPVRVPLLAGHA